MPFLEATGLSKSFGLGAQRRDVLRGVNLSVERGEFVSILGAMGSGKSTLLGMLAGLIAPDAGTVTLADQPVRGIPRDSAYVFQNYSLLPWLTALENVRLAVQASRPDLSREQQRQQAQQTLEQVGLGNAIGRRPRQLSGGMRQRVAIARALATHPSILFMDEPFGALDALTRSTLQQDMARLCSAAERPVTVVMITNNVEEALLLSDRIVPMVSARPATLGAPIPLALSRPRTEASLAHDEDASHVRAHVVATLTASMVKRVHPGPEGPGLRTSVIPFGAPDLRVRSPGPSGPGYGEIT
jgi:nitrate/nitrite transport system ATP-binding protein